ncbi:hypothetical protein [Glycomyces salinus]|uniref:hypothetical protein n=1 Tax=Glycomyces salinus TaxID=980294 RepID=UPI0018EA343C|nr:hypothetical protein [Glycomyces salinus]
MAELQMRLLGQPDEVRAVVEALTKELSEEPPILRDVSPVYPTRGSGGDVRVYLKLDGARLADELTSP